jgi:hypothetical protein
MIVAQPSVVCRTFASLARPPALECRLAQTRAERSLDWAIRAATWAQTRLLCRMPKCASAKRRGRAAVGMRVGGEAVAVLCRSRGLSCLSSTGNRRWGAVFLRRFANATRAQPTRPTMDSTWYSAGYEKGTQRGTQRVAGPAALSAEPTGVHAPCGALVFTSHAD